MRGLNFASRGRASVGHGCCHLEVAHLLIRHCDKTKRNDENRVGTAKGREGTTKNSVHAIDNFIMY